MELRVWLEHSVDISVPHATIPGVPGIDEDGGALMWSRVLSYPRGPWLLHGHLEQTAEVEPVMLYHQSGAPVNYAFGMKPLGFWWVFPEHSPITVSFGVAAGALVARRDLPPDTLEFDWAANGGMIFRFNRVRGAPSLAVDFAHISNGDLARRNPSINYVRFRIGFRVLRWPK